MGPHGPDGADITGWFNSAGYDGQDHDDWLIACMEDDEKLAPTFGNAEYRHMPQWGWAAFDGPYNSVTQYGIRGAAFVERELGYLNTVGTWTPPGTILFEYDIENDEAESGLSGGPIAGPSGAGQIVGIHQGKNLGQPRNRGLGFSQAFISFVRTETYMCDNIYTHAEPYPDCG